MSLYFLFSFLLIMPVAIASIHPATIINTQRIIVPIIDDALVFFTQISTNQILISSRCIKYKNKQIKRNDHKSQQIKKTIGYL